MILKRSKLTDTEEEVIAVFEGQLAQVRSIKRRMLGHPWSGYSLLGGPSWVPAA